MTMFLCDFNDFADCLNSFIFVMLKDDALQKHMVD